MGYIRIPECSTRFLFYLASLIHPSDGGKVPRYIYPQGMSGAVGVFFFLSRPGGEPVGLSLCIRELAAYQGGHHQSRF